MLQNITAYPRWWTNGRRYTTRSYSESAPIFPMPNLPREHSSAKTPILIVVTLPLSRNFYNGVLGHLCRAGFGPILLSAPDDKFRSPAHSLVPVTFFKFTLPTGRHDEKGGSPGDETVATGPSRG